MKYLHVSKRLSLLAPAMASVGLFAYQAQAQREKPTEEKPAARVTISKLPLAKAAAPKQQADAKLTFRPRVFEGWGRVESEWVRERRQKSRELSRTRQLSRGDDLTFGPEQFDETFAVKLLWLHPEPLKVEVGKKPLQK
jgi:hypothetical protein